VRVLQVSPFFAPAWCYGGLVESVFQFSRNLAREGATIRVLTTDANGPGRSLDASERMYARNSDLEVQYCKRVVRQSVSIEMLRALAEQVRWADVVHLHAAYSFPTIPTLLAARAFGRPLVWTPHGALQRWQRSRRIAAKRVWEQICQLAAPSTLVLHLTSDDEEMAARARFPRIATAMIPNGVEIPEHFEHKPRGERFRIGFLGRLDPKKGIENLLEAFRIVKERGAPALTLEIAGSGDRGYESRIQKKIEQLGLTREVAMIGNVRGDEKRAMLERCDFLVVPSFTENFAIVVAEALAHGCPVIASKGTPWSELERRNCGLWVESDAGSLADAIERIVTMPLSEMGARGRQWMIERYRWPTCARELLSLYNSLLAGREPALLARAHQA
jgi:glycosyltransferase involved in cell wall biosynthesis